MLAVLLLFMVAMAFLKFMANRAEATRQYQAALTYRGPAVEGASAAGPALLGANTSQPTFAWPIAKSDWPKTTKPILDCDLGDTKSILSSVRMMVPKHTKVYAAAAGEVVAVPKNEHMIIIKTTATHDSSVLYVVYDNLVSRHVDTKHKKHVTKGQLIGETGNTSPRYGNSLVFGIWKTNKHLAYATDTDSKSAQTVANSIVHPMNYLPLDDRTIADCSTLPLSGIDSTDYYQVPGSSKPFTRY